MSNKNQTKSKINIVDASIFFDVLVLLMLIISLLFSLAFQNADKSSLIIQIFSYLCAPLSVVGAIFLLSFKKKENVIKLLAPKKPNKIAIIATVLITFGMLFGISEVNNLFVQFLNGLGFEIVEATLPKKSFLNVSSIIIFVCIIPAVFEEVAFRGIILKGLTNGGKTFAILLSGALFSLFHMSPEQTFYQFIVGVLYSLIVLYGGDYTLTIASHLFNNLFIVLNYYFFSLALVGTFKIVLTVLGLVSLIVGVILLLKNKTDTQQLENKRSFINGIPIGIIVCIFMWIINLVG